MFGSERSLLDALPHYHLDYQEQLSADPEQRWSHRITVDGKWAPNLFNFYYRVYPRLVEGLDVPFKLDRQATRIAETHVHEALREALVNTLIHADHQSSRPITVVKRQDAFVFFNPGRLRIPREALYQGGVSDPRNPNVQKMFQMLGLGEKAGSGFQKILRAWREQHWMIPLVAENPALEMTRVWLPLASMIPSDVEQELRAIFGDAYRGLDELGRVILMLAHRFDEIGNADIQPYRAEHPREIGVRPKQFVEAGWLEKSGHGRGTRYRWAAAADRRDGRVQDPMRSPPAQGLAGRDDRRSNAQLGYAHAHYGYDQKCSGASTEGVRGEPRGRAVLRHAAARAGVAVRPARPQLLRHRVDRPGGCWLGRRSA
jgi:ATP-dependent DNA helicase RecG